ncbi:MAG: sensor histidine kinase [Solirubrobacteraceae bacterium]
MSTWRGNRTLALRRAFCLGDIRLAAIAAAIEIGASTGAQAHGRGELRGTCLWASSCRAPSHLDAVAYVLLALGPAALVVRRRHPRGVLTFVFGVTLAYVSLGYVEGPNYVALLLAVIAAARAGEQVAARGAVIGGWFAFLWLPAALGATGTPTPAAALGSAAWLLVLLAVGEWMRVRRERSAQERRTRELQAGRKADEERLRIARELHDVLAHSISVINVQSGVALHLIDDKPEQARTALAAINDASAEALREVRSVLGALRGTGERSPRSPTAGLARLDDLLSRAASAGVEVSLEVTGRRRPLPAGMDLAAFRIVQESLTNVVRHARAATAAVTLDYGGCELTVQVDDGGDEGGSAPASDGADAHEPGSGAGSGIAGMRERALALGGSLTAGPLPAGGFRVRASLPLPRERGSSPPSRERGSSPPSREGAR